MALALMLVASIAEPVITTARRDTALTQVIPDMALTTTVELSIIMEEAIRTEALQCGRTSPLQSRHTLRRRCGRQGITVIRTRTMAAIPTTTRTMAQAMAMLVRLSLRCSGGWVNSVITMV